MCVCVHIPGCSVCSMHPVMHARCKDSECLSRHTSVNCFTDIATTTQESDMILENNPAMIKS